MKLLPSFAVRFIVFFLLGWLCFSPGLAGAFVSDFIQWAYSYQKLGAGGIAGAFNDFALHHFLHLVSFVWLKLFGLNETAWGALQIGLHALSASLIVTLVKQLFRNIHLPNARLMGWFSGLLFLLSPYQTEAVIWSAALHYLLSTCFVLGILVILMRAPAYQWHWATLAIQVLFILALASFEISLVFPFLFMVLWVALGHRVFSNWSPMRFWLGVIMPQLAIIVAYFGINKLFLGKFVGHYGADTHLSFDWALVFHNYLTYPLKWLSFWRYWSTPRLDRNLVNDLPEMWPAIVAVLLLVLLLLLYRAFLRNDYRAKYLVAFITLTAMALFPVINLEVSGLFQVQSDRYGYFASAFFYPLLVLAMAYVPIKALRVGGLGAFLAVQVVLLTVTVEKWHQAGKVMHGMVDSFEWTDASQVYILNVPDNLEGVYLFRHGTREALALYHNDMELKARVEVITTYLMLNPTDSVAFAAPVLDSLVQASASPGSWFIGKHEGESHLSANYKVEYFDGKYWLRLHFSCLPPNAVLLYQAGAHFKQIPTQWVVPCQ